MPKALIDLNSDMGEGFGVYRLGDDEALFPWITSVNVACGFHAGDPRVMAATVARASRAGVAVGAHPGLPDLVGFGRRDLAVTPEEARTDVLYQLGALAAFCRASGVRLSHVKPHGQLYNLALRDARLAAAVVEAVRAFDPHLAVVALGGELLNAARKAGLRVAVEAFADRAYRPDGTLLPRSQPGSVITDVEQVVARAVRMAVEGTVEAVDGTELRVRPHTLCVHGDTPGAAALAQRLRQGLEAAGVTVRPLPEVLAAR
jgi:UPF0271 protein